MVDDHNEIRAVEAGGLRATVSRADGTVTVRFEGELDMTAADAAAAVLREAGAGAPRAVVVDLQGLTFMDSTGVRLLIDAYRRSSGAGHAFAVRDGAGPARRVLRLVQLDGVLPMIDSTGGAG